MVGQRRVWPAPMWVSTPAVPPSVSVSLISTTPCGTSRTSPNGDGEIGHRSKPGRCRRIGIGDMSAQHAEEIIMVGSEKRSLDETRQSSPAGLIIRQKEPINLEMPFDQVDSYLTATELLYIRSHFPTPKIDATDYRLRIDGAVGNPLALSYRELRESGPRRGSPLWSARVMVGSFSSPRLAERNGSWAPSATQNGRVCHCEPCWSVLGWKTMRAKSCSKEPIAARRRKSPYLRVRSPMLVACPRRRQFSRKSCWRAACPGSCRPSSSSSSYPAG